MLDLRTFFKNHFDTDKISDDNMRKFAEIHLQRLSANNTGGQYTTMITSLTAAYTAYYGALQNEDAKYALQQGLTITLTNIFESFKSYVSLKEGIIRGTFGKESAQYQEFFPQGLLEFTQATLANVQVLIDRMVLYTDKYQTELGPALLSAFEDYKANFISAREAQLQKIGEVKDLKVVTSTTRDVVENELMKNVHLIAAMYIGNVEQCILFFDQSFIRDADTVEEEETPTEPTT